jgi:hypothetical protein
MRKIILTALTICAISLGLDAQPATGDASRPSVFKKAKIKVEDVESPLFRMFSTNNTIARTMEIFSDRDFKADPKKIPKILDGLLYHEGSIQNVYTYVCLEKGEVLAMIAINNAKHASQLEKLGFAPINDVNPFFLFGDTIIGQVSIFKKTLAKDEKFTTPAWTVIAGFEVERPTSTGELLYNGIRLPKVWPPQIDFNSDEPMPVPYLKNRPKLVNIDIGRQLFVDDFLVEKTDLKTEYHYPKKYEGNPVLKPETEIEKGGVNHLSVAGPKSGGLWWNYEKQLFEFWYEAGWVNTIAYATSKDGIHWDRPNLPLNPGTNQVLPTKIKPDSWTVVPDYTNTNPKQSYKIFLRGGGSRDRARAFVSEDAIGWGELHEGGLTGDRSTMFYNPFRMKWVFSLRWESPSGRSRAYWEADEFLEGMQWLPDEPFAWARTDKLDKPDPRIGDRPSLYNLDAVAYESIMLGFFEVLHGPVNEVNAKLGLPKNTGLNFAYSRDGFHWYRPDRTMAINSEQRDVWDRGYVQSLGNICIVRGDMLWFYYIGFAGDPNVRLGENGITNSMQTGLYGNGATGIAFLRRDGFVSLNSQGKEGSLTTRPLIFSGKHLFVNIDAPKGTLYAEAIDIKGNVIEPFSFRNCIPAKGDSTLIKIEWINGDDLTVLNSRAVRFRFKLQNGKFYSFWVSQDKTGRSNGYVAGGGPGYTSNVDNVGRAALEKESKIKK